jgi:hypothetical protein
MPRALAMLKYVPAVLCGLLAVAWVVTLNCQVHIRSTAPRWQSRLNSVGFCSGSICFESLYGFGNTGWIDSVLILGIPDDFPRTASPFGNLGYLRGTEVGCQDDHYVDCPILLVITCLLPLTCGCLTRFRFPLWSYFAWTALLAAELAYYLR